MESGQQRPPAVAIVAEKPSVARDIARVIGANVKGNGYLHGQGYIVTWAVGHLVRLAQPHEMRPEWKVWRRDRLPMLPAEWPLVVIEESKDQFDIVRRILTSPKVGSIICATDAGREGELIFRYIYEAAGSTKPVSRLWVSSLTPEAIRNGLDRVKPATVYDALADAAKGRSRADWLVGMNLSRAYTLGLGEDFSVGRVQTPTLAMLVERELAIRDFVPEDYIEVTAKFSPHPEAEYEGTWFRPEVEPLEKATRLPADGVEAEAIVARARTGEARIESMRSETQRMAPPLLYDLTELQRHANRIYGYSAQKTLELAQALYERHKLISYPRTDSRHLSADVAKTLPRTVEAIAEGYRELLAPGTGEKPLGRRFVDDAKVTDHHAIVPTAVRANRASLNPDEFRIYDLVCRRLLSAWHGDFISAVTTVVTAIVNGDATDRYRSSGTIVIEQGWKVLDIMLPKPKKAASEEKAPALPEGLAEGQPQQVLEAEAVRKKTRPPKRFTEATLLTAMETAGRTLDDKELSDAMKDCGLGTPATRAAIIEVLLKRSYIERQGKSLAATAKGIHLIEAVHPEVKSPAMTGQWEAYLDRIHRGKAELTPFLEGIERYVREVVDKVSQAPARRPAAPVNGSAAEPAPAAPPDADPERILKEAFRFEAFRPGQEEVCRAVMRGEDVLLVMPTGSGKSLCYQLPAIARGGTALILSPLIALMEDQVAKLRAMGFAADRIHSGRDRAASRQASLDYLNGNLQFLYVAPERLRVAGFPEMLAKRKPTLVAIDEAHCISHWGHDFRPDYRRIGQHLPALRPAPVIALTATATRIVQRDIVEQLGLARPEQFIRGFRRDNIAIEVVDIAESRRDQWVEQILADSGRRPAIVYTPTRRDAEALAARLKPAVRAAAYHAGMDSRRRDEVQAAFLGSELEVVVATIAFGMGVDKPDIRTVIHTALPGSMEAYYQEIGRAGRDGAPSRAILMQSYSDRRTHDYFFEREYPAVSVLDGIYGILTAEAQPKEAVLSGSRLGSEMFDTALEKLWIHGGAQVDAEENIARGEESWRQSYEAQREHKQAQIAEMLRFAECNQCRMATLVRHFGDVAGARTRCGVCDFCAPGDCVTQQFRPAGEYERQIGRKVLTVLRTVGSAASGRLHQHVSEQNGVERRLFERIVSGLARAGLVEVADDAFDQGTKRIAYKRVMLTAEGRALEDGAPLEFEMTSDDAAAPLRRRKRVSATAAPATPASDSMERALRAWRLQAARTGRVPAFRILSDKALRSVAAFAPKDAGELGAIHGVGRRVVEKYGTAILAIVREQSSSEA